MPWYGREFYSDENVMVMTFEQEAVYLRLLWNCWQEGSIPAGISKLAAIVKNMPKERFEAEVWPALRDLFVAREDGRLIHQKVEFLRAAKDLRRKDCSRAGKLGSSKRWPDSSQTSNTSDTGAIDPLGVCHETAMATPTVPIADYRLPIAECKEPTSNTCAPDGARLPDPTPILSTDPPFESLEPQALFPVPESPNPQSERRRLAVQQSAWFEEWWNAYWLKKSRKRAQESFARRVRTEERFREIMEATRAQFAEMLSREPHHRPHGATWLNGERWNDEAAPVGKPAAAGAVSSGIQGAMRLIKERREA